MRAKGELSRGRGRRTYARRDRFDLRQALFTFAALVAIFAQTFVVQTHVDLVGTSAAAEATRLGAAPVQRVQQLTAPSNEAPCVLCQTLATAGAALSAASPVLATTSESLPGPSKVVVAHVFVRSAYSWQSRAPPFSL